jgi:hypothetical protein
LWVAEIRFTGAAPEPGVPQSLFTLAGNPSTPLPNAHGQYNRFAVTTDGERFLMTVPGDQSNVVGGLADGIARIVDQGGVTGTPSSGAITVVLDWPRMVGTQ